VETRPFSPPLLGPGNEAITTDKRTSLKGGSTEEETQNIRGGSRQIKLDTREHSNSRKWFAARTLRLTASLFGH